MNIKKLLIQQSSAYPEKLAFVFEETNVTFPELKEISFRLANYLAGSGIKKDDKVAVYLSNIPEVIFSLFGVLSSGACIVPLDFMLTEEEIITLVNHSEAKILIAQPKKGIDLHRIKEQCSCLQDIVVCRDSARQFSSWEEVVEKSSDKEPGVQIEETSISSIYYTSGSLGRPKGVMLTYKNLDCQVQFLDHFIDISDEDIYLSGGVPFSHTAGLAYALYMLYFGSTLILMERFHPLEFLKNVGRYNITIFFLVPSMYVAILSLKGYEQFTFPHLRYAVVFGAPSTPDLLTRFNKTCPNATLINGWGMTELSGPVSCTNKITSIGPIDFNVEVKIVDDGGNTLGDDELGELWAKGPGVMPGYYREEELTREVLTEDGWLKTGDIFRRDREGFYYVVGRKKDMIKVAGEVVFSTEVEEAILRHPRVRETAVVGIPERLRGEVPKAFIVLQEGQILDKEELREFLKKHLAHFKMPHHFEFVEYLPKTRTGKVDKASLKGKA